MRLFLRRSKPHPTPGHLPSPRAANMGAVQVSAMHNASDIVAHAATLKLLRIFQVSGNAQSDVPLPQFPASGLVPWQAPLAGGNGTLLGFSAVCFIMGSTLYEEHLGSAVPIGLLHSSHGGTSIQAWQSPAGCNSCGDNSNSWNSSVLYNSNIFPLVVGPVALKGAYFFQGEQDCGIGASETYYRAQWWGCSIQALISDWRSVLHDDTIFFVVQQLHAWLHTDDIGLAVFRHAQAKALLLPGVAMAVAFDGGDPASAMAGAPGGTVHSHQKFIPGRRSAAAFAGALYKLPVAFVSPAYQAATARSFSNATHTVLKVVVAVATASPPLTLRGWEPESNSSHCPTERAINASYCSWFGIQANDAANFQGTWYNATPAIGEDGVSVVLTAVAPGPGKAVVATSNGWSDWPVTTVYDSAGLPLNTWLKLLNDF